MKRIILAAFLLLPACASNVAEPQPTAKAQLCAPSNFERLSSTVEGEGVACPPPPYFDRETLTYPDPTRGATCLYKLDASGALVQVDSVAESKVICHCTADGGQTQYSCAWSE